MNKKFSFLVIAIVCIGQELLSMNKDSKVRLECYDAKAIEEEFGCELIDAHSPRASELYLRNQFKKYPSSISPKKTSFEIPLSTIAEEDELISQCFSCTSPKNRLETVLFLIGNEEYSDAKNLIQEMGYEGKFSPSIAMLLKNELHYRFSSSPIFRPVSPQDFQITKQREKAVENLAKIIECAGRASNIASSALKSGRIMTQDDKDCLDAKITRMFKDIE